MRTRLSRARRWWRGPEQDAVGRFALPYPERRAVVWMPDNDSIVRLCRWAELHALQFVPAHQLHLTVLYSNNGRPLRNDPAVGAAPTFPLRHGPNCSMALFGPEGKQNTLVVHLHDFWEAHRRNADYLRAGGVEDFEDYKPHITIVPEYHDPIPPAPDFPITFVHECDWEDVISRGPHLRKNAPALANSIILGRFSKWWSRRR